MSNKISKEEFIKRAKHAHNNKYDYSKVEYINITTKICIICPEHGEFWQRPNDHINGTGCPKCAAISRSEQLKITNKIKNSRLFVEKANKIYNNKYSYEKVDYINDHIKVCIICSEHGEFWQTPKAHLNGNGCPKCAGRRPFKYSAEENEKMCRQIHGDKYEYFFTGNERRDEKVKIKCRKHNYIFEQILDQHLRGCECPICSGSGTSNTERFIISAKEVHGDHYDYSKVDYKGKDVKVEIICPIHGSFWQTPHDHISGCGCKFCKSYRRQERLFFKLKEIFPEEKWKFEYSPDWLGLYRIDIFNERINLAIEYNGEQHYKPVEVFGGKIGHEKCKERDQKKAKLLEEHGCKLYIIPYWEYNLEEIIDKVKTFLNYDN